MVLGDFGVGVGFGSGVGIATTGGGVVLGGFGFGVDLGVGIVTTTGSVVLDIRNSALFLLILSLSFPSHLPFSPRSGLPC